MKNFKMCKKGYLRTVFIALLAVLTALTFSSCALHYERPEKALDKIDSIAENIGRSQITDDDNLIGERHGKDDYTGYYTAQCDNESGRDVVFGGASIKQRHVRIYGTVYTQAGTAKIRIRQSEKVKECEVDKELHFEAKLDLSSGGNYIMIDYNDFQGCVELHSDYILN